MSNNTKAIGLLSDLQKLDEAGRDRILDLLSPEAVKDILKALLRQRDRGEGESGAIAPETLVEPSQPENIALPDPPATENISGAIHGQEEKPTKRARQITTLQYRKRVRTEKEDPHGRVTTEKQVIEIESDEENGRSIRNLMDARQPLYAQREPLITDSKSIAVKGLRPTNLRVYLYVNEASCIYPSRPDAPFQRHVVDE